MKGAMRLPVARFASQINHNLRTPPSENMNKEQLQKDFSKMEDKKLTEQRTFLGKD